jgi:iron(III) transport system permease protein
METLRLRGAGVPLSGGGRLFGVTAEALAILALVPLAAAVVGSLGVVGPTGGYVYWWGTARGWESLARTMAVAAPAGAMAVLMAWVLVASAVHLSPRWAVGIVMAACLPLLVPSSLLATAWIVALGREGLITGWLRQVAGDCPVVLYTIPGAAAVTALRYFGIAALVLLHARLRREGEWPASRVAAIPPVSAAWHLELRADARPALAAWLLVTLFSMNDPIIPGMLLVSTYGTQVLIQYSALLNPAGAAALAAPMAAVGAALMAATVLAGRDLWFAPSEPPAPVRRPRGLFGRLLAALAAAVVLALALAVPAAVLVARTESPAAIVRALADARDQAWQTLYVASAGAAIATAAAAMLAHHWVAQNRAGARTAVPLVLLNLTVPPSLLGIGMIALFQGAPTAVRDSAVPLVLGYAVRFLPVATLLLYALWRREPPDALLAARVHGVPAWRAAWTVTWLPRRAAVAGAALLAALFMATDLETSIFLAPAGGSTLGVRLYTLIHTAPDASVAALALGILALTVPAILLLAAVAALGRKEGARGA